MNSVTRITWEIKDELCVGSSFAFNSDVVARDFQRARDRMRASLEKYRRPRCGLGDYTFDGCRGCASRNCIGKGLGVIADACRKSHVFTSDFLFIYLGLISHQLGLTFFLVPNIWFL